MSFYLGYAFGVITSGTLLFLGFCAQRYFQELEQAVETASGTITVGNPFKKRVVKKKPKYVSEEEEARREQKSPPLDPGLG